MYVVQTDPYEPLFPVFECKAEHFELLLEQASGALIDARDE